MLRCFWNSAGDPFKDFYENSFRDFSKKLCVDASSCLSRNPYGDFPRILLEIMQPFSPLGLIQKVVQLFPQNFLRNSSVDFFRNFIWEIRIGISPLILLGITPGIFPLFFLEKHLGITSEIAVEISSEIIHGIYPETPTWTPVWFGPVVPRVISPRILPGISPVISLGIHRGFPKDVFILVTQLCFCSFLTKTDKRFSSHFWKLGRSLNSYISLCSFNVWRILQFKVTVTDRRFLERYTSWHDQSPGTWFRCLY